MTDQNEAIEAIKFWRSTRAFGGSFAKALGEAAILADSKNLQKIKDTWPELWQKYLNFITQQKESRQIT